MYYYKSIKIEYIHLYVGIILITIWLNIGISLNRFILLKGQNIILNLILGWVDTSFIFLKLTFIGVTFSIFLQYSAYQYILLYLIPYIRISKNLSQLKRSSNNWKILQNFHTFRQAFIFTLIRLIKLNNEAVSTFVTKILVLHFVANAILIIQLSMSYRRMSYFIISWTTLILFFQAVLMSLVIKLLLNYSKIFYKQKYFYTKILFYFSNMKQIHSYQSYILTKIVLDNFYRIIHCKERFVFTFGCLGKITPKATFALIPLYSSLIIMLLKHFTR